MSVQIIVMNFVSYQEIDLLYFFTMDYSCIHVNICSEPYYKYSTKDNVHAQNRTQCILVSSDTIFLE